MTSSLNLRLPTEAEEVEGPWGPGWVRVCYTFHYSGPWRWIYVVTSITALWLNVFVFIVQSFEKIPSLHAMAPTQTEPPFKITQIVVLLTFIVLGICAVKKFRPAPEAPAD